MKKRKGKKKGAGGARQVKKNHLRREIEYGQLTMERYERQWKKITMGIGTHVFRKDALVFSRAFEKVIDYKDMEISLLMDWVEADNYRYIMSENYQCESIDKLINYFYKTFEMLYQDLISEINKLKNNRAREMKEIRERAQDHQEYLGAMKYRMTLLNKQAESDRKDLHVTVLNDQKTKMEQSLQNLQGMNQNKLEKIYKNLCKFIDDYENAREEQKYQNINVITRFETLEENVIWNTNRLLKLDKLTHLLTQKYNHTTDVNESLLNGKRKEHNFLHQCHLKLRRKLYDDKLNDRSKLNTLIETSNEALNALGDVDRKGTAMLKYVESCRRYEALNEKILPYLNGHIGSTVQYGKFIDHQKLFRNRIAGIDISRYALNEEYLFLKKENHRLKQALHKYCQCAECPSLPTVKERTGKIPYTEGREAVRKAMMHNESSKFSRETSENVSINTNTSGNI